MKKVTLALLIALLLLLIGCSSAPPQHWKVKLSHKYHEDELQLTAKIINIYDKSLTLVSAHFVVPEGPENILIGRDEINKVIEPSISHDIDISISEFKREKGSLSNEAPLYTKDMSQLKLKVKWLDNKTQYSRKFP